MTKNDSARGAFAIVIASFLWGTTGTAAQFAPTINPLAIGAFAMGTGGVLLCLFSYQRLLKEARLLWSKPMAFLFGSMCVAIYPLAFYSAMHMSGVAIGTVVSIASAPLFAAVLEYFFGGKAVSLKWFISFVLGVLGIGLLSAGKVSEVVDLSVSAYDQFGGILLGLVAGLTYAGYAWVAKQFIDAGTHSTSSMAGLFGCAALFLLPSLFFTGDNLFSTYTNISVSLYMGLVPMFLGYILFSFGLRTINTSQATLITLIEPVVATLLAIYLVGEQFMTIGWIGMILVCLCLCVQSVNMSMLPIHRAIPRVKRY